MTISLALRFIPTLLDETDRIMKAQASRGVDFQEGKLSEKIRAIVSLIVPLFISAFQRSDELANAMEARGYDPSKKRTRYRLLKWKMRDTLSLVFILVLFGVTLTLSVLGFVII
jgi:energy-coupling factor transport system permease protein